MSAAKKPLTFDIDRSPPAPSEPRRTAPARASQDVKEARQQVGARVTVEVYRQLKVRAAMQGEKVQELVERAITEYLANHPS